MLTSRLKILPADKAFKKIITKDAKIIPYKGYEIHEVYNYYNIFNPKKNSYMNKGASYVSLEQAKQEIDKLPSKDANPTKDDDRIDFSRLDSLIKEGRIEVDSWIGVRGSHGVAQVRSTTTGKLSSLFVENIPDWFKRKYNIGDANPDLINMYRQKFEEAIDNGDKEEMKRWFREIMSNVTFDTTDTPDELPIGKHNDVPGNQFDADELAKGIQIEMEHTDDEILALAIAKDHLSEIKDYYTRLIKMEAEAKA